MDCKSCGGSANSNGKKMRHVEGKKEKKLTFGAENLHKQFDN